MVAEKNPENIEKVICLIRTINLDHCCGEPLVKLDDHIKCEDEEKSQACQYGPNFDELTMNFMLVTANMPSEMQLKVILYNNK